MVFRFGTLTQRTLHECEVVVSITGVFVAYECRFEMPGRGFVFTASIKGQAESDMRGCEARITFQSLDVSRARFTFFALLVQGESRDIALLCAGWVRRIGKRARRGLEIRIVVDWRVSSISQQHAAILALERQLKRQTDSRHGDRHGEDLRGIQIDLPRMYLLAAVDQTKLDLAESLIRSD